MPGLTPKQERFAREVASGKSQAEAYRVAFDARGSKPATVHKRASELMANGEVTGRVEQLREKAGCAAVVTLEGHLTKLQDLRDKAEIGGQLSAAIQAEMLRGKVSGFYTERLQHSGPDGGPIELDTGARERLHAKLLTR